MVDLPSASLDARGSAAVQSFVNGRVGKGLGLKGKDIIRAELVEVTAAGWRYRRPNSTKVLVHPVHWPEGGLFLLYWLDRHGSEQKSLWWTSGGMPQLGGFGF